MTVKIIVVHDKSNIYEYLHTCVSAVYAILAVTTKTCWGQLHSQLPQSCNWILQMP